MSDLGSCCADCAERFSAQQRCLTEGDAHCGCTPQQRFTQSRCRGARSGEAEGATQAGGASSKEAAPAPDNSGGLGQISFGSSLVWG